MLKLSRRKIVYERRDDKTRKNFFLSREDFFHLASQISKRLRTCKQTPAFSRSSCPETGTLGCQEPFQNLNHVISAGEALKQPRELLWSCQRKKARCFFQKNKWIWLGRKPVASASNEKGRWHGVVCRACSRSPGPASPPTATPCHHRARWPVQDTGFSCTG